MVNCFQIFLLFLVLRRKLDADAYGLSFSNKGAQKTQNQIYVKRFTHSEWVLSDRL